MKIKPHKIEVESNLTLTGRELELLNHILSYNNKDEWVAGMVSSTYAGGVTKEEMIEFLKRLGDCTRQMIKHVNAGKDLLRG